jgi:acyl carrier protein
MLRFPLADILSFDAQTLTEYCVDFVAEQLQRAPAGIDINAKFTRIGFDSAMSIQLIVALEELLGVELDPDLTAAYPTIANLCGHLASLFSAQ